MGQGVICKDCISETPEFDNLKYIFSYDDYTGKIIKKFKYSDATYLSKYLVNLLYSKANFFDERIDIITSVPITAKKLRTRKYNQSAILAKYLARRLNVKYNNQLLLKVKETDVQAGLNKKERQKNLKDAFILNPKYQNQITGKNILIVDDVYTTGTTMNECAKTIKQTNADCKIFGLVLARVFLEG